MIYVTGDTHGDIDLAKIKGCYMSDIEGYDSDTDRYVLICGDFGLVWYPEGHSKYGQFEMILDWLSKQGYTTLFIDGNHENFDLLNAYPIEMWHGGKVHKIRDNIIHLMRGQIFEINGKTIFTMGGAVSIDKHLRYEGISWWRDEVPNNAEIKEAMTNLDKHNWTVDYVITHATDNKHLKGLNEAFKQDEMTKILDNLIPNIKYKRWFGGHYHMDKSIDNYTCLYGGVITI